VQWVKDPDGGSGSSGADPHLRTFDGVAYDFQAAGEFVFDPVIATHERKIWNASSSSRRA
jgi:hypothetical protein